MFHFLNDWDLKHIFLPSEDIYMLTFTMTLCIRNGKDIHRELCGFYFLADGSITIYEFRQFGKK